MLFCFLLQVLPSDIIHELTPATDACPSGRRGPAAPFCSSISFSSHIDSRFLFSSDPLLRMIRTRVAELFSILIFIFRTGSLPPSTDEPTMKMVSSMLFLAFFRRVGPPALPVSNDYARLAMLLPFWFLVRLSGVFLSTSRLVPCRPPSVAFKSPHPLTFTFLMPPERLETDPPSHDADGDGTRSPCEIF